MKLGQVLLSALRTLVLKMGEIEKKRPQFTVKPQGFLAPSHAV